MSNKAIKLSNIAKKYKLGNVHKTELHEKIASIFKKEQKNSPTDFWALQDINFSVEKGEAIGIIGKNGAGKSTLLKILSKITKPTHGRIEMEGRVASLLEVGTGFHNELSGRENIFLNGTILGMKKDEIRKKFDDIVEFSGVGKFIETPVKRYSSGMKVRLAFSVAAHLEPEILIIDEVLAVGDAEFQKKCLGKMKDVAGEGRTVLFVSHNTAAVANLTSLCLYLKGGSVAGFDSTKSMLDRYLLENLSASNSFKNYSVVDRSEDEPIKLYSAAVDVINQEKLSISLQYHVTKKVGCVIAVKMIDSEGACAFTTLDTDLDSSVFQKEKGLHHVSLDIPVKDFNHGKYYITVSISDMKSKRFDYYENLLFVELEQNPALLNTFSGREGILAMPIRWRKELDVSQDFVK